MVSGGIPTTIFRYKSAVQRLLPSCFFVVVKNDYVNQSCLCLSGGHPSFATQGSLAILIVNIPCASPIT